VSSKKSLNHGEHGEHGEEQSEIFMKKVIFPLFFSVFSVVQALIVSRKGDPDPSP
jgi:hypothetical protein